MVKIIIVINFVFYFTVLVNAASLNASDKFAKGIIQSRRISQGTSAGSTRPYMVYLRPAPTSPLKEPEWLCGGVIIHERYVLTSAACIEDAVHLYVVSGTNRYIPQSRTDDKCVKHGAKKVIWKCTPKGYIFDGYRFNNINWMRNDIAVVKVEDAFNFKKKIEGCDYVPAKIAYNNESADLEKPNNPGYIAGWGSDLSFTDPDIKPKSSNNAEELKEAEVMIISKKKCKKNWDERYWEIIDQCMICSKDVRSTSEHCLEHGDCKADDDVEVEEEDDDKENQGKVGRRLGSEATQKTRQPENQKRFPIWRRRHQRRNSLKVADGGFCQNDHGGPLIKGRGLTSAVVIGIMSGYSTQQNKCRGPFLYTSVFNHRQMIACAVGKKTTTRCRSHFSSSNSPVMEAVVNWDTHPDGDAKEKGHLRFGSINNNVKINIRSLNDDNITFHNTTNN